jgi:hypothetical protein
MSELVDLGVEIGEEVSVTANAHTPTLLGRPHYVNVSDRDTLLPLRPTRVHGVGKAVQSMEALSLERILVLNEDIVCAPRCLVVGVFLLDGHPSVHTLL